MQLVELSSSRKQALENKTQTLVARKLIANVKDMEAGELVPNVKEQELPEKEQQYLSVRRPIVSAKMV
jgi:hypothetical protein